MWEGWVMGPTSWIAQQRLTVATYSTAPSEMCRSPLADFKSKSQAVHTWGSEVFDLISEQPAIAWLIFLAC